MVGIVIAVVRSDNSGTVVGWLVVVVGGRSFALPALSFDWSFAFGSFGFAVTSN